MFGTVLGLGLAFGPVIAGTLVGAWGWRAFFAAAAVVLLPALAAAPLLEESRRPADAPMDWGGAAAFTLGLSGFAFGVVEGPALGWTHPAVLGAFAACAVLLGVFAVAERRHPAPLVDLSLLLRPRFAAICSMPFLLAFGFVALTIVLPPYLMATLGMSPGRAGLTLLLLTGPTLVMPPLTSAAVARGATQRTLLVATLLLVAAGTALLALVPGGAGPGALAALAAPLLLIGTGFGVSLAVLDGAALSAVPTDRAGMAAGLFNTARITGEVVALSLLGASPFTLTRARLAERYGDDTAARAASDLLRGDMAGAARGVGPGFADTGFADTATAAYAGALHTSLWLLSALSLIGAVVVARLPADRGPVPRPVTS
ncbi:hypothetical protein GCM10009678_90970 [Actinomadura kijaniata]|uniref:Major facilitator superfamily (MFS) profile domain-containing protein n=1 Tax=Actinomadura namibiensis TaxID=182080 RepID=A0A7W3LR02_ACTNM|nr:MFS transporter [Actinomadura namibiensis]MBA8952741.1 hypothetical protein [Actinomadura namibiensis]